MIQDHAAAILSLLDADNVPPPLVVLDGVVPTGTNPPYVLAYFSDADPELADSRPLTGASQRYVIRVTLHCVGGNQLAARIVARRARTQLLDVVPTVVGRMCLPIRREEGQPTQRDESTGTPVMDLVEIYRLESLPA